jgi:hypothetical protein
MGNLMSFFVPQKERDIFINFEKPSPKAEEERVLYEEIDRVLNRAPDIVEHLTNYKGCGDLIRKAITSPSTENEDAAWSAVLPCVDRLKDFYDYSLELEQCVPKLLTALCKENPANTLQENQALAKLLANLFDFVLRFDDLKMTNPAIQNDFSYYRRTLNRLKLSKTQDRQVTIKDDLANRMSLFYAYPTPMMKCLGETTQKYLSSNPKMNDSVHLTLATFTNACNSMVVNRRFESEQTYLFCLRAMTAAIVLYDHVHPVGAFHRRSPVNIKGCVLTLKNYKPAPPESLLNALRFTTVHLNDDDTPSSIKQLLA